MATLTFLPLDLSGARLSNRITQEPQTLIALPHRSERLILLRHGGFYTEQLTIFRPDGSTLKRGVDWRPAYLYQGLTELTTQEAYGLIVIKNPDVPATVKVSYRAIGGLFGVPVDELKAIIRATQTDQYAFTWDSIVAKPSQFNAEEHKHKFWQVYGWDSTLVELDRIRKAILVGDQAMMDDAKDYAALLLADSKSKLDGFGGAFEQHYADFTDPHVTTKLQIGLPRMENWGMATKQQSLDGVANKYTNPTRVYQQLAADALPSLNAHVKDFNRPHGETAAQIGSYTEAQINEIWRAHLPREATAVDSHLLGGYNYINFYDHVHYQIPTGNVVSGVFHPARIANGAWGSDKVLVGGWWRSIAEIFAVYDTQKPAVFYVGYVGNEAQTVGWLNANLVDWNSYPNGTYVIGKVPITLWNENVIYQSTLFQRSAGGWGAF